MIIWSFAKFDCLYDYYGVKAHFVPQIEESRPAQSVLLEARSVLREKNSIHGGTHFAIHPLKRPETV